MIFVAMFLGYRGMFSLCAHAHGRGNGGVGTFIVWKGWSMLTGPMRVQSLVLKSKGRIKAAGVLAVPVILLVAGSAVWSGGEFASLRREAHEQIDVPIGVVFRAEYEPTPRTASLAESGMRRFELSERIGWALNAEQNRSTPIWRLIAGETELAERVLGRILEKGTRARNWCASTYRSWYGAATRSRSMLWSCRRSDIQ